MWKDLNETQMRIRLSDKTTTKEKGSLCLSASEDVMSVFVKYFAEERKAKELENAREVSILRSEAHDSGKVAEQQPNKRVNKRLISNLLF